MVKSSTISVRVTKEIKQGLEKLALEDGRSLASYVERILAQHLKEKTAV